MKNSKTISAFIFFGVVALVSYASAQAVNTAVGIQNPDQINLLTTVNILLTYVARWIYSKFTKNDLANLDSKTTDKIGRVICVGSGVIVSLIAQITGQGATDVPTMLQESVQQALSIIIDSGIVYYFLVKPLVGKWFDKLVK